MVEGRSDSEVATPSNIKNSAKVVEINLHATMHYKEHEYSVKPQ